MGWPYLLISISRAAEVKANTVEDYISHVTKGPRFCPNCEWATDEHVQTPTWHSVTCNQHCFTNFNTQSDSQTVFRILPWKVFKLVSDHANKTKKEKKKKKGTGDKKLKNYAAHASKKSPQNYLTSKSGSQTELLALDWITSRRL